MHIMKNTGLKSRIIELADEMRTESMPQITEELFGLFEKNGNRLEYEAVYFLRRKFLAVYGLAVIAEKRPEDILKLEEVLEDICREETWALPAHCNRKTRPNVAEEIDLFNSETAGALSETVKEAADVLDAGLLERVIFEIGRRVLIPFTKEGNRYGFEHAAHNWNSVCCSSIGTALINVGEKILGAAKTAETLDRINASLGTYVDSFGEDGACLEGAGYFNYGMSFLTAYMRRYEKAYGAEPAFAGNPKLMSTGKFPNAAFFGDGASVNFSDASDEEKLHAGMLEEFEKRFDIRYTIGENVTADFDTDPCYRFLPLLDDLRYGIELDLSDTVDRERFAHLPDAEWVIAENADGIGFAIKGGNNDEPHNHNDVGSFIFKTPGGFKACELGAGEYTADYFGVKRYDILCNSTRGHSLMLIGGKGQKCGKEAKAKDFRVENTDEALYVSLDLTDCYNDAEKVTREAVFDKKEGFLKIHDEAVSGKDVTSRIISKKDIGASIEILSDELQIQKTKEIFMNHSGIAEDVYIFEIKEKTDGTYKKGDNRKRIHSFAYRIYP